MSHVAIGWSDPFPDAPEARVGSPPAAQHQAPAGPRDPPVAGLRSLWNATLGDPRVCIAVVDGPVDRSHATFAGARLSLPPGVRPKATLRGPAARHGTHVASVIFGQHGGLVPGVAPRCRGLLLPVFGDLPDGSVGCSQLELAQAILLAAARGAHVINVSGGQFEPSGEAHPLLADAVRRCGDDVLVVAAAGNEGCECLHVPGAIPSVLAVGAMDAHGEPLESSNWGSGYESHGILAPGTGVLGADVRGGIVAMSGTSYATAIVSGVAGLLLSLQLKHGRPAEPAKVRETLLGTAVRCTPT